MEFKNWLETTLRNINQDSGIDFKSKSNDYVIYDFVSKGYNYSVGFSLHPYINLKAWEVTLTGPEGYSTTNYGNFAQVYGHLVQAVKKFINKHKPEALMFSGFNRKMDLVYDNFYKRFLEPYFTRVSGHTYVRNDLLKNLDADVIDSLHKYHGGTPEDFQNKINNLRSTLSQQRKLKIG